MNSPQALAWLKERTVGEIDRLLQSWTTELIKLDDRPLQIALQRSGRLFAVVDIKTHVLEAMLEAMALAIAAGEMEIDAVKAPPIEAGAVPRFGSLCPIKRVEVSGKQRACFLAMGHETDHEDTLGHWYESVGGVHVKGIAIPK